MGAGVTLFYFGTVFYNESSAAQQPPAAESTDKQENLVQTDSSVPKLSNSTNSEATAVGDPILHKLPVAGAPSEVALNLRIYEVQSGDTLSQIAEDLGIGVATILGLNNLKRDLLSVGQKLVVTGEDGILIKVKADQNLDKLASEYKTSAEKLIADNGISGDGELPELIFCRECLHIQNKLTASSEQVQIISPPSHIENMLGGIANSFPKGNCTYYVASKMKINFSGHARDWLKNAKMAGYKTGNEPAAGTAVITKDSPLGHVAFVESVSDSHIQVSEMNYEKFNIISKRSIPISSASILGYIYPLN